MGLSLSDLPKSAVFTSKLPSDPDFPTPTDSHGAPRSRLGPRRVKAALYTYVRPEKQREPELLAVSPAALRDLGLRQGEEQTELFKEVVSGNRMLGWDEETRTGDLYPWAQCYGGWQFGSWADQLGDGRVMSLFEATDPSTNVRHELQLKGAGRTPYSRFADGNAVLRSSVREFVVSEALHALGIPTTRALALTLLPHRPVHRERTEPGAIVARFAQSWLRIGTFDLLGVRRDRALVRRLADYVAEDVFGGWHSLPGKLPDKSPDGAREPRRGIAASSAEGSDAEQENRYARLYREIVRRNAATVAAWQAFGFMNGVLNTDNTSLSGLSMDFGPFAFMDNFDPAYTPNHDDYGLRYSYGNQPSIIWWNLTRLAETLGELIGAGCDVDDDDFIGRGPSAGPTPGVVQRAKAVVERAGNEYKAVLATEYRRLMANRLGLKVLDQERDELLDSLLELMESLELDFNHFFRRLSKLGLAETTELESRKAIAERFFHRDGAASVVGERARERLAEWLGSWRKCVVEDLGGDAGEEAADCGDDEDRKRRMKAVNPKFTPRNWILDEVIEQVEHRHDRTMLLRVLHMSLHPFDDEWDFPAEALPPPATAAAAAADASSSTDTTASPPRGVDMAAAATATARAQAREEAERFCADPPKARRAMQCSCSS